jgi:polar amino acid transport system substrate-binding protein
MIRQEMCYTDLNVKIACSHGGVTPANDGASHQAIEDMGICVESLKGGALDAVIMDRPVAENYVATGDYKILEGTLLDEQNFVIAKEGNTEIMDALNKAIDAFLKSEDCTKLKAQYGLN